MKKLLVLGLFITSLSPSAQTASGSLETYLNSYLSSLPGATGDNYVGPTVQEAVGWDLSIEHILNGAITSARMEANSFNYQVKVYTDTDVTPNHDYYILEEKAPQSKYWGTYVFNPTPCRETLVIQAPHPDEDFNTGKQAAYCFVRLNAKALFFPGTNRCNHSSFSSCDGTTSVCSESATAFRISDVAHNDATPFQSATETLYLSDNEAVFVQLHGFSKKESDPYVILGNGTQVTPENDPVLNIKEALFAVDNTLTFKVGHIDLDWDRLLGTTNTQGRFLNGSVNPCEDSANTSVGNFVHVEQEKTKLRADATGWQKMSTTLENAFACMPLGNKESNSTRFNLFPNPTNSSKITITGIPFYKVVLYDVSGKVLMVKEYPNKNHATLDISKVVKGVYLLGVFSKKKTIHRKLIVQ